MTSMDASVPSGVDESVSPNVHLQSPTEEDTKNYFDKYDMTHTKRGVAVIFNNETFRSLDSLDGTIQDTEDFKNALIQLGFDSDDIKIYPDRKAYEMENIFNGFGITYKDSDIDCFVCAIMSYGDEEDMIYGYEGEVKLNKLLSYLKPDQCPSLNGIPKLIFVQACRKRTKDSGIEQRDAEAFVSEKPPTIPLTADMLVFYSSFVEYPDFRVRSDGSWFMQILSCILKEDGDKYEIMKLLTAVCNKVDFSECSNKDDPKSNGCKQMPCIMSTFRKTLKFPPKN